MKIITLLLLGLLAVASPRSERPIAVWVTAADQSRLFQHEEVSSAEKTEVFIEIDTAKKFQEMDGFGAAMTDASAELRQPAGPENQDDDEENDEQLRGTEAHGGLLPDRSGDSLMVALPFGSDGSTALRP